MDQVIFAYSDVPHEVVMHKASMVLAAGADFRLMGEKLTQVKSTKPVVSVCAVRTGSGKVPDHPARLADPARDGLQGGRHPPPDALRRPGQAGSAALRHLRRPRQARVHHRGARGIRTAHRQRRDRLRRCGLREDPAPGRAGSGHRPVGRRQQRLLVLRFGPEDRGGRPAPPRAREQLSPRRGQRPRCGCDRDQQGGHRRPAGGHQGAREPAPVEPQGDCHRRRLPRCSWTSLPRSRANACW